MSCFGKPKLFNTVMKNTAGLHPEAVAPSAADGAPLSFFTTFLNRALRSE